jgi:hypothetical protein
MTEKQSKMVSNALLVTYSEEKKAIHIKNPLCDDKLLPISLDMKMLKNMGFKNASRFIGERIILFMPILHDVEGWNYGERLTQEEIDRDNEQSSMR